MRISDVLQSFPVFITAMILVGARRRSATNIVIALSLVYTPIYIRLTRAEVLTQRQRGYVESARAIGCSEGRIALRYVLPNSLSAALTQSSVTIALHPADRRIELHRRGRAPADRRMGPDDCKRRRRNRVGRVVAGRVSRVAISLTVFGFAGARPWAAAAPRAIGMAAADTTLLEAQHLDVTYAGRVRAVQDFNLRLRNGEIVGLNGLIGKRQVHVAYALPGSPSDRPHHAGTLLVGAEDLLALPETERRRICGSTVALIVQNPRAALHPIHRIGQQIGEVLSAHDLDGGQTAAERRRRVGELLQLVGIADPDRRIDAFAPELSGGMAQRVLIAMALSTAPKVLMPMSDQRPGRHRTGAIPGSDVADGARARHGHATGDPGAGILANYCDRILVMSDGKVVEDTSARSTFELCRNSPAHTAAGCRPGRSTPAGIEAVGIVSSCRAHEVRCMQ